MKKLETHRGIRTNPNKKHESKLRIIKNRFGQYTLSLPRIDDKKRLAGYPGLTGWSRALASMVPICKFYVEPLAGMAKVYQALDKSKIKYAILNDKAKPLIPILKQCFPGANITNTDFIYCIKKYDTPETFQLIDVPWYANYYAQGFSTFTEKSIKTYDEKVLDVCKTLTGKFIITSKPKSIFRKSDFTTAIIKSEYAVCGNYPELMITTNLTSEELN